MEKGGKWYDMPSGAKLYVCMSNYENLIALHDALFNELRGKGVGNLDLVAIQKAISGEGEEGLNVVADKIMALMASRDFKAALFACAEKAVYCPDGAVESAVPFRLNAAGYNVFDNPKCREKALGDFYDIAKAIGEENLRPFAKALSSMFAALVAKRADTQKSTTGPELAKATS